MRPKSRGSLDLAELSPSRVCLIKPSALGDVVHALPVLAALRRRWPEAHIAWVVNSGLRGLIEGHPQLDEVIPFDRARAKATPAGLAGIGRFLLGLRRRRFDLAIDLQGLLRSGLMTAATGAPTRVGLADAREGATRFYTHRIAAPAGNRHAVDVMLAVAAAFGADVSRPRFDPPISPEDRRWAAEALAGLPRPVVVFNPGARWLTKRWPPEHFAAVARRAAAERGAGVVVVGSPEDRPLADAVLRSLGPVAALDLCGRTTLPQLAAVAAAADLFVSNDTGPLHLAVAAGAKVVGIYTCTSPEKTGPYSATALAVRSCVWCAPSFVKTCPRMECMAELSPDRVWPAVAAALGGRGRLNPTAA